MTAPLRGRDVFSLFGCVQVRTRSGLGDRSAQWARGRACPSSATATGTAGGSAQWQLRPESRLGFPLWNLDEATHF
jgi:hypothetical protein